MPYKMVEEEEFECDEIVCINNNGGYCTVDENVDNLEADDRDSCFYFKIAHNKEVVINCSSDIDDFLSAVGEGVNYVELDSISDRLVLKVMHSKEDNGAIDSSKGIDRLTVFRVNAEDECSYRFFVHADGGVGAIHRSIDKANFFNKE